MRIVSGFQRLNQIGGGVVQILIPYMMKNALSTPCFMP
jgi:hypothetical protein